MQFTSKPDQPAVVLLPTTTPSSYVQTIIGKPSPISNDIEEFRGIPYAHVPGRWEHSRLRDHLPHDIFDATENGPRCPAQSSGDSRLFQSYLPFPDDREDEFECLNLVVVRPSNEALAKHDIDAETTKLPVLVWIHGGGFTDGAATNPPWDPARLVLRGLTKKTPFMAVAINYRLGIFGFGASSDMLATQDSHAPIKGVNFGLRDQKLALIWIKRNIAAFGGDGTKITIMGHSAGGVSCHVHLLEAEFDTKQPLFRKAGLLSGAWGGLDFRSLQKADERWADLCRMWSVQDESPVNRLDTLKKIPPNDLLHSVSELHWRFFVLVIDELTIRESNLGCDVSFHLGHDELDSQIKASHERIQVMVGATADEFKGFVHMADWDYFKFHSLFASCYPSEAAAQSVLQAYDILPTSSGRNLFEAFAQFISDATMVYKVHRAGEFFKTYRGQQALLSGQDPKRVGVQFYHIEFGNPFPGPMQGVAHHGVELIYAFGNFDGALEKADRGVSEGYVEPDQELAETAISEVPPPAEVAEGVDAEAMEYKKSNIDLSLELQDKLIDFVVEDVQTTDERADSDKITTYRHDRSVRVESWTDTEKWRLRRQRYDALEKDLDCTLAATRRLVGSVLDMPLE